MNIFKGDKKKSESSAELRWAWRGGKRTQKKRRSLDVVARSGRARRLSSVRHGVVVGLIGAFSSPCDSFCRAVMSPSACQSFVHRKAPPADLEPWRLLTFFFFSFMPNKHIRLTEHPRSPISIRFGHSDNYYGRFCFVT